MRGGGVMEERRDYVTLTLPAVPQQPPPQASRSWRRRWKQLPRLQRVVVVMVGIGMLAGIALLLTSYWPAASPAPAPQPSHLSDKLDTKITTSHMMPQPEPLQDKVEPVLEDTDIKPVGEHDGHDQIAPPPGLPQKRSARQEAVVGAMKHAWKGYKTYAWGHDHLRPISRTRSDWLRLGLTLVDALDTLWIMDLREEFSEAREWVATQLNFNLNQDVNLFETTIRVLGGLLSTYHLTKEQLFLDKAVDLGERLVSGFNSGSGVPFADVNLYSRRASKPKWGPDSSTSEVTTIQLEFRDLSRVTGNPIFEEKASFVSEHIHKLPKTEGLVPIFINAQTGQWRSHSTITLGARGDSYYEYLLKQWVQTGRTVDYLRMDYNESVSGMEKLLAARTQPSQLLFFGELHGSTKNFVNKMDELTCYLPGTLALGVHYGMPHHHLHLAQELMYTCVQTWLRQPTRLAAEITYFNTQPNNIGGEDFYVKNNDAHYLLRPETIESLWYLYHLTGNTTYQDWGWQMFQGIEKHCKVENGYTSIGNVRSATDTKPKDKMESFFLGETLKYLYLLFMEDQTAFSLDKWVFNSEAHPLPIYSH
ncbi:endoplasmic reticulum mannosyl-oligosaccharide 1,2-alpha-mannosidase-like [Eriocheir sinensis]|uniref:endoplasmic reticulum mannosyl-oligosaccharide 1,2-alpha-mannosidase-like n=1 Tax=Eriocheir sinensis TaxID=95602 RepID=UPI0021CAAA7F|nr:endoplasmic reticulum mannosyl-oligosaccharide 1,2-alpha-mannosidase-like [Eriocheir sinensis]XP_050736531.1 endoplasmic reticulum mannosyl-oligosaccharide 1,2-alpha-mannosidase-like [Eriocheir sinensis]